MKKIDSQKVLLFPSHSAASPTVSIHPELWAEATRPTDLRDLRLDKTAALRQAIASGTYRVSAADLAEKLLHHLRSNA